MTSTRMFNAENVAALLRHLPDGSFAVDLVAALETAATRDDARSLVFAALDERVKEVRAQVHAETEVA